MEKQHQVFLCSPLGEQTEERQAAIAALLDLNCCPVGAGLFGAALDEHWLAVERLIDAADYVFVICGRELPPSSVVQGICREYDYAIQRNKPVMAFLSPGGERPAESNAEELAFRSFRERLEAGPSRYWTTAFELSGAVSRTCAQMIQSQPGEGWIRARHARTDDDYQHAARLAEQVLVLEKELAGLRGEVVPSVHLAQGNESVELNYRLRGDRAVFHVSETWGKLFEVVALKAIDLPHGAEMATELSAWIGSQYNSLDVEICEESFWKVRLQFFALGLIEMRPMGDERVWALTPRGRALLGERCGVHSQSVA